MDFDELERNVWGDEPSPAREQNPAPVLNRQPEPLPDPELNDDPVSDADSIDPWQTGPKPPPLAMPEQLPSTPIEDSFNILPQSPVGTNILPESIEIECASPVSQTVEDDQYLSAKESDDNSSLASQKITGLDEQIRIKVPLRQEPIVSTHACGSSTPSRVPSPVHPYQDWHNQPPTPTKDDNDEQFTPFHGERHRVSTPESLHSNSTPRPLQTVYLPSLSEVLSDEQKMAFAALCFLTFHELSYRYARFEYFDVDARDAQKKVAPKKSGSGMFSRSKELDEHGLLDSDEDYYSGDDDETQLPVKKKIEKPKSKIQSIASLNMPYKRQPFGDELSNPETIQDVIFFGKTFDGNLALCYALKEYQEWSFKIMDKIYEDLNVSQEERLFIEQSISLGLATEDLVKCLKPQTGSALPLSTFQEHIKHPHIPEANEDKRPFILWNLIWILLNVHGQKYNARSRAFLRRIAVDHLDCEGWYDVIEHLEIPITAVPAQEGSSVETFDTNFQEDQETAVDDKEESMMKDQKTSGSNSMVLRNNERSKRSAKDRRRRFLMMTAAAVGGGTIIGVSAGLAAPIIGAGLGTALAALKIAGTSTFLTGVGGSALLTSGAVITGTGYGAAKMEKRTRGVEVFRFIPIQASKERSNLVIYVAGWVSQKESKGKLVPVASRRQNSTVSIDSHNEDNSSSFSADSSKRMTPDQIQRKRAESRASTSSNTTKRDVEEKREAEEILATGLEDLIIPFAGVSPLAGSQYTLCFDPHELARLGSALKIFASELISFSTQQILQQTIVGGIVSGLTWPLWLVKLSYLVDNPWGMGLSRSQKAGLLLADSICNNVHEGRPVTLVGYSLGARVIFYCLRELALRGKFDVVEDVFLFGTPVLIPHIVPKGKKSEHKDPIIDTESLDANSPNANKYLDEWREAISAVSGRLFNCYSRTDWVLGFLFRAAHGGVYDVAGLSPIILDENETPDVIKLERDDDDSKKSPAPEQDLSSEEAARKIMEQLKQKNKIHHSGRIIQNVDVTAFVQGHQEYRTAMPTLLNRVAGFPTWTEDIDVLEQVIAGDWMNSVDGWWKDETERIKQRRQEQKQNEKNSKRKPSSDQ